MKRRPAKTLRLRRDPPPICPEHNVLCYVYRTEPRIRRFYCPVEDCTYRCKQARRDVTSQDAQDGL